MHQDLSILLFGHTRPTYIADVLESLKRQGAAPNVDVWLDGHQGSPDVKYKTELVRKVVSNYQVRSVNAHNGQIGFRKLILHALDDAANNYRYIIVLEDDCFPTHDAIDIFIEELKKIEDNDKVFSVYGHPFLVPEEGEVFTRFQGWGWATTSEKLKQYIGKLIYLYSLRESEYLEYVKRSLSRDVIRRLDVTPQRQPTETLTRFFAWDETLALLTVLSNQLHKKTPTRTIYNFGASEGSSRFKDINWFTKPPYNMVSHENIWDLY
jgi:hypothetical protein